MPTPFTLRNRPSYTDINFLRVQSRRDSKGLVSPDQRSDVDFTVLLLLVIIASLFSILPFPRLLSPARMKRTGSKSSCGGC